MKGALLVNLGSPDSTSVKDVRRYLDEFLMDQRVIDTPYLLRAFLVKGIILNTRSKRSSEAYKKIWTENGSPLIEITRRLSKKVDSLSEIPVVMAMRYGNPSMEFGIQELADMGVDDIYLIPLYPQFAMATTETVVALADKIVEKRFPNVTLSHLPAFYNDPDFIDVLSDSIQTEMDKIKVDHLLFSYHGLPERHIKKSDITKSHCSIDDTCCKTASPAHQYCYRHQCFKTTSSVIEKLDMNKGEYTNSFQSRLGRDPWLQPYTSETLVVLANKGVKKLAVVTPAFVSDCLATLEEIAMEGKKLFIENGGEEFYSILCLNDNDNWAALLAKWINTWNKS
jgi:ferrochelatase